MGRPDSGLLIWGGGGHGKVVADVVRACGLQIAGYVDAEVSKFGLVVEPGGARVVMLEAEFLRSLTLPGTHERAVVIAVGDNRQRERCFGLVAENAREALVHPSAVVSPSASIGGGTVVFPNSVINAGAQIGEAVIVNSGSVIEHDCRLGRAVHVSPGAVLTGGVMVGDRSWIGAAASVLPGVVIGSDVVVGAGAVVLQDVPSGTTVVGNPAREIPRK